MPILRHAARTTCIAACIATAIAVTGAVAAARPSPAAEPIGPAEIAALARLPGHLTHPTLSDPEAVHAFLEDRIAPHVDFDAMARWAAGPFYERFGDTERHAFAAKLKRLFLRGLARNLAGDGPHASHMEIYPTRFLRWGDEASVNALVTGASSAPMVLMVFRFHRRPDGWKMFDAAANGFSAVSFFRTYFASLARRQGPHALYR